MAVSVELRTTCPKCGNPVPVNAAVGEMPCPICEHVFPLPANLWHEVLSEVAMVATGDRTDGQTTLECGATLTRASASPQCATCGADLSADGDLVAEVPREQGRGRSCEAP